MSDLHPTPPAEITGILHSDFIEEIKGVTSEDDPMFSDPYYMSDPGMMGFPPDEH